MSDALRYYGIVFVAKNFPGVYTAMIFNPTTGMVGPITNTGRFRTYDEGLKWIKNYVEGK